MIHLLIDGYNLLHALDPKHKLVDLEEQREDLLIRLHHYQQAKQHQMTVVFDGGKEGHLYPQRQKYGEIEVIFSLSDVTADEHIESLCEDRPGAYLVISSDNQVQRGAQANGSSSLSSQEFLKKLELVEHEMDFMDPLDKEDSGPLYPKVTTKKKGVSKKLPRRERRKLHQLKKL